MSLQLSRRSFIIIITLVLLVTTLTCIHPYSFATGSNISSAPGTAKSDNGKPSDNDGGRDEEELFCAVVNPTSGSYIDLSQLSSTPNKLKDGDKKNKGTTNHDDSSKTRWLIKGWGYNTNFTLGICSSPVTEDEESQLNNLTGAFYEETGKNNDKHLVSIGNFGTKPTLLGNKKLTLKYENGSKCPNNIDRKSTLINFVCDKEISAKAQITYIGSLHDCSYFFEVRSVYACPTSNKSNEVNVLGIFVGIFAVFFLVEFGGRRWLYGKMKARFNPQSIAINTYNSEYIDNTNRSFRPRWEFTENESNWKSMIKKTARLASTITTGLISKVFRMSTNSNNNSTARGGPIRLNSSSIPSNRSQDSFIRDMEQQNNIIDSLEVVSHESNSSATSLPTDGSNRRID